MIRLTVARYYTPAGRCIQKPYDNDSIKYEQDLMQRYTSGELTSADSIHFPDSLKTFTKRLGRPVYGVLTQKSLIGLANELPMSGRELLRMPGFGKKSLEMFGKEILAIIQEYIEDNPV